MEDITKEDVGYLNRCLKEIITKDKLTVQEIISICKEERIEAKGENYWNILTIRLLEDGAINEDYVDDQYYYVKNDKTESFYKKNFYKKQWMKNNNYTQHLTNSELRRNRFLSYAAIVLSATAIVISILSI
jgi:hypothetical protein